MVEEIFVEFPSKVEADRVKARFHPYGIIRLQAKGGLRVWFKPYDDICADEFIEWLNEQGIEYDRV